MSFSLNQNSASASAPTLPIEILEEIFESLAEHHPTLASCTRVRRSWTPVARKHIYCHLRVSRGFSSKREGVRSIADSPPALLALLHANAGVGAAAKILELRWVYFAQTSILHEFMAEILGLLPRLTRVCFEDNAGRPLVEIEGIYRATDHSLGARRAYVRVVPQMVLVVPHLRTALVDLLGLFIDIGVLKIDQRPYARVPVDIYPAPDGVRSDTHNLLIFDAGLYSSNEGVSGLLAALLRGRRISALYMRHSKSWPVFDACAIDGKFSEVEALRVSFEDTPHPTSGTPFIALSSHLPVLNKWTEEASVITGLCPQLRILQLSVDVFLADEGFITVICYRASRLEALVVEFPQLSTEEDSLDLLKQKLDGSAPGITALLRSVKSLRSVICVPATEDESQAIMPSMDLFASYFSELRRKGILKIHRKCAGEWSSYEHAMKALSG